MPTPEDVNLLLTYDWPGNIRELASVINRAALLGNGKRLETAKALGAGSPLSASQQHDTKVAPALPTAPGEFRALDRIVSEHIKAALTATQGRVEGPQGAARLLGVNPHTLRGRMRKLGIDWRKFREVVSD